MNTHFYVLDATVDSTTENELDEMSKFYQQFRCIKDSTPAY